MPRGPHFEIAEREPGRFVWALRDGKAVAGVAAAGEASFASALMRALLVKADPARLRAEVAKAEPKGFAWTLLADGEPVARGPAPHPSRGAASEGAKRFKALVAGADVPPAPAAPVAAFSVAEAGAPLALAFDGTGSRADGAVAAWRWDFGDGGRAEGATAVHAYAAAGEYRVRLEVADAARRTGSLERTVSVAAPPQPPQADPGVELPPVDPTVPTRVHEAARALAEQQGVPRETIREHRAAVLRGSVSARGEAAGPPEPLAGVRVSVLGHPEYGHAVTREDGAFDMAVNGGGTYSLAFGKDGFLPLRRRVTAPWEDFAPVAAVVMTPLEAAAAQALDLRSDAPIHVLEASSPADDAPARRATLMVPGDVTVTAHTDDGKAPVEAPTVHLAEYTRGPDGPAAMPAELPPNSGYTYAVELSVAGAEAAEFDRPVVQHVENFLGFPVGTPVPAGRFDPESDAWVPGTDGRVIAITGEKGGLAEIDVDGKGPATARKLAALGIGEDERRALAAAYAPGQTLWRVPLDHFSSWDFNWPFGPPEGAEGPNGDDPRGEDDEPEPPDEECGSRILAQSQVLGESIPIPGTPYSLTYSSDRVPGRRTGYSVTVPLTGATVPEQLTGIELEIAVAGQEHVLHFDPAPDLRHTFAWDGRDGWGRELQGRQKLSVRIGFTYKAVYQRPDEHERSFARYSGVPISAEPGRKEITIWREWTSALGSWDARGLGLGGWQLDVHHVLDRVGKVIHLGGGGRRPCDAAPGGASLEVLAGPGQGAKAKLRIGYPQHVAVDAAGTVYFSDSNDKTVRRIAPDGSAEVYVGPSLTEETPIVELDLAPTGIALGPDGSLYVASEDDHQVRRVDRDGTVVEVAGTGSAGFGGDGTPAAKARLNKPQGIAVGPDGTVFVADKENRRVRRIGTDGIIATVAGDGRQATDGDGGPATAASLYEPKDVALAPDGSLYVADAYGIRRVAADGTISTVAGTNDVPGLEEPAAGPATAIAFTDSMGIDIGHDGSVYFSTWTPPAVWRLAPDGTMAPLAGLGGKRPAAGLPGTEAELGYPGGVAMGPEGALHFVNTPIGGQELGIEAVLSLRVPFEDQALGQTVIPDPAGAELYTFDAAGRHRLTADALTGAEWLRFDYEEGRLSAVGGDAVPPLRIERGKGGEPRAVVVEGGTRVVLATDGDGYLSAAEVEGVGRWSAAYGNGGLLTSFERPSGLRNEYAYDELGRLVRDETVGGGVTDLVRTERPNGYEVRLLRGTPPALRETSYAVERLPGGGERRTARCCTQVTTTETAADGTRATHRPDGTSARDATQADPRFATYVPLLKSAVIETPGGVSASVALQRTLAPKGGYRDAVTVNDRVAETAFDAEKRTLSTTTPARRTRTVELDPNGRLRRVAEPGGGEVLYSRDRSGRVTEAVEAGPAARRHAVAYNRDGSVESITDPLGRVTRHRVDAAARTVTVELPDGRAIRAELDEQGSLAALVPPGREAHAFTRGQGGLMTEYRPPGARAGDGVVRWEYDAEGRLRRVLPGGGAAVELARDDAGRVVGVAGGGIETRFERAVLSGYVTRAVSAGGVEVTHEHDGFLRTATAFGGPVTGSVRATHTSDFAVADLTVGRDSVAYDYDEDGLIVGAGDLGVERTPRGGVARLKTGDVSVSYEYDAFGQLVRQAARAGRTTILDLELTRDAIGRITAVAETAGRTKRERRFEYDDADRLVNESVGGAAAAYRYDANGNRVARDGTEAEFDAQDRLLRAGEVSYAHSPGGAVTERRGAEGATRYGYDPAGALTQAVLPDGRTVGYLNDAYGRRVAVTVDGRPAGGFLYHVGPFPVAELDARGRVAARFVYASDENVPDLVVKDGTAYLLVKDHVGSVRAVVETYTGEVAQRLDYDAFGRVVEDSAPGFQPFGFAGGLRDPFTGLTRFVAREYDAEAGRFTGKDPLLFGGGDTNLYAYCGNDPVNSADPYGLAVRTLQCALPDPCDQFDDLPVMNNATDALWQYYYGRGQPVRLGPDLIRAIKESFEGDYVPSDQPGRRYTPLHELNARLAVGGFAHSYYRGKMIIHDRFKFDMRGGNIPLALTIGNKYPGNPTGGLLNPIPHYLTLGAFEATPFDVWGCFEM